MFHQIYSICADFILDFQEMTVFKTPKQHKKSAVLGSQIQSFPESPKSNLHILSISNGTYFFSRSKYAQKYRFSTIFAKFWISCQIVIRRPARLCRHAGWCRCSLSRNTGHAAWLRNSPAVGGSSAVEMSYLNMNQYAILQKYRFQGPAKD